MRPLPATRRDAARRRLSSNHRSPKASNPGCGEAALLAGLRVEHRDLDAAIAALSTADSQDQLQIARLKKRKLRLKDQIAMIEDYLTPDIIA